MQKANKEFLQSIDELANKRKNEILNTKDEIVIKGTTYYVASNGNDNNDGLTPNTPWQTTQKVSSYPFAFSYVKSFLRRINLICVGVVSSIPKSFLSCHAI
jgi:hypothetical protein